MMLRTAIDTSYGRVTILAIYYLDPSWRKFAGNSEKCLDCQTVLIEIESLKKILYDLGFLQLDIPVVKNDQNQQIQAKQPNKYISMTSPNIKNNTRYTPHTMSPNFISNLPINIIST